MFVRHDAEDEEGLEFSLREILTKVTYIRGDTLGQDLLSLAMLLGATRIGDMIMLGKHGSTDEPLLQFARHFRNARAHGDRWNFRKGEPAHPAACRDLVLTASLHGQRATWETVSPRYVEFLDDISNFFVPGSAVV